jgi:ATP-dependent helicase/nuclease subunit B
VRRYFIDWKLPFLRESVRRLLEEDFIGGIKEGRLDLSDAVCVFPSSKAMRLFEEHLVLEVERLIGEGKLDSAWIPPETVTVGALPELLYTPSMPFASRAEEILAWRKAVRRVPGGFDALFSDRFPKPTGFTGETEIAFLLARLYHDVASEGLDFSSPRDKIKAKNTLPEEVGRWAVLCDVQKHYLEVLEENNLCDRQKERLTAVEEKRCGTERQILLFGAADLNGLQIKMLNRIDDMVTVFVQAPEREEPLFDEYGRVLPDRWQERKIKIPDSVLIPTANPDQEGNWTARYVGLFGTDRGTDAFHSDRVSISMLDTGTLPTLTEALTEMGVPFHFGEGKPFSENRVALLLRATADYLRTGSYDDFAKWIRHPDVERRLRRGSPELEKLDWLSRLDEYQNSYIPLRFLLSERELFDGCHDIGLMLDEVGKLFRPITDDGSRPVSAPLTEFPRRVAEFLGNFYSDTGEWNPGGNYTGSEEEFLRDYQIDKGLEILYDVFNVVSDISEKPDQVSADQAISFFLRCASGNIPDPQTDDAVSMSGWLDARFDESPAIILVGFNEGIIPESKSSHTFLPDTIRRDLAIEDNARRYARDAYFLSVILENHSPAERQVRILFARGGSDGGSMLPSRLLLMGDSMEVAERIERFFGPVPPFPDELLPKEKETGERCITAKISEVVEVAEAAEADEPVETDVFSLPILRMTGELPEKMSITDFASFLYSPYNYFLEKDSCYGLRNSEDADREFGKNFFGIITHDILADFGRDEAINQSADDEEIYRFLSGKLDAKFREYESRHAAGTALLQLEQIRRRLRGFARWQAEWHQTGAKIIFAEKKAQALLTESPPFVGENIFTPVTLSGSVDRIDYNPTMEQWFVFDYKTFEREREGTHEPPSIWSSVLEPLTQRKTKDDEVLLNIRQENIVETEHRDHARDLYYPIGIPAEKNKRWKNLQLPLYAKLAETLIPGQGRFLRGENPLALGYITLGKDFHAKAYLGNWTPQEITEAIQTARWIRSRIQTLWREGVDPHAYLVPETPELGRLYEPPNGYQRNRQTPLRDFPD